MISGFRKLILQIIAGILGIWLATEFVNGITFTNNLKILLFAGLILGLINFFIKPILNLITLPLRVLTLGLFSIVINMAIVWVIDVLFIDLQITGLVPLFWTTIIIWILSVIASKI